MTTHDVKQRKSMQGIYAQALEAWVRSLLADVVPSLSAVGVPEGEVQPLPAVGIEWGRTEALDQEITHVATLESGRQVWRIFNEEAAFWFAFRCVGYDDADAVAAEFVARAHYDATTKNESGTRTTVLTLKTDGAGEYQGRIYIEGDREPLVDERSQTDNEFTVRVPAVAVYPVIWVQSADVGGPGIMYVQLSINGTIYRIPGAPYPDDEA